MNRYPIVIENVGGNFSAYAPDLPGCIATGATAEEVKKRMQEAIEVHLEGLREDAIEPPKPYSYRPSRPGTTVGRMMQYGETGEDLNKEARDILRITALEEEMSTPGAIPYPAITKAAAWLKVASDRLYEYAPTLEAAEILRRTESGFDFQCRQTTLACLLAKVGFSDWKRARNFFTCMGKPLTSSIKQQASSYRTSNDLGATNPPEGWYEITAVIPELDQ